MGSRRHHGIHPPPRAAAATASGARIVVFDTGGAAPQDTDRDGMPDAWEASRSLNSTIDDSAADRNGEGWTNIEEYINGFWPVSP